MKERTTTGASATGSQPEFIAPSAQTIGATEQAAPTAAIATTSAQELATETTASSTNQVDAVTNANVAEPISSAKSDRNKNLISNDSQLPVNNNQTLNNTGSSCSQSPATSLSSSNQQKPTKAELTNDLKSDSTTTAEDIGKSNSYSSNCLPAKGSSAEETDRTRAISDRLDSELNIKNNNNIIENKGAAAASVTAASTTAAATAPASETNTNTATTATSNKTESAATAETKTAAVSAANEDTKDVKKTAPANANVTDTNQGLTESINTINNNKNAVVDKDADNNDVISNTAPLAASSAAPVVADAAPAADKPDDASANQSVSQDGSKSSAEAEQPAAGGPPKSGASRSQTLLKYEEGQWSPDNVDGRKFYNRDQLLQLQKAAASTTPPQINEQFDLFARTNFCMPSFATGGKNQSTNARNSLLKRSTQGQQMQQGGKGSKHGMIHMSLSLREDVKLNESANAWKPTFMHSSQETEMDNIEALCKKVRGILNKLTPEKFEPLLEQIQALNIDSQEKLTSVINLVFEKAIDEPNFAEAYAMLCKNLTKPIEEEEKRKERKEQSTGLKSTEPKITFKKELVNKCQKEFDNHVADEHAMQVKLTSFINDLNNCNEANRKQELRGILEEEERKLRRRSVGTVRFIGELYRQGMLTTNIMDWCITTLLNIRTEEKLECLCKLLTTVGHKMEEKTGAADVDKKNFRDLTPHFQTMQSIADNKKQNKISSRVRFMLLDVIELRRNKWASRRNDCNQKTLGQIQKEAEQEQYNRQILNYGNMGGSSGGMGGGNRKDNRGNDRNDRNDRGSMRNDSRSGSGGGYSNNSNNNKSNRGGYQDNDGWTQAGNKNRGSSSSTSIDPSKFRAKAVSITPNINIHTVFSYRQTD